MLKLTGGGLGAMAVGGTLVGSASAETADGNCVQIDFVTGTSEISDLSSSTYSGTGRLIAHQWGEMVDNNTAGESGDRTPKSDTCDIDVSSGDPTIDFSAETATVNYQLSNCGGDQDLLLVSYESPCNGAAGSGGQWDPANAGQQAVFDTATATTQSDGSLTVDVPPLPAGVPQRSNAEAYYPFDGTAGTNCITGVDGNDQPGSTTETPTKNVSGVSSATNNAWEFSQDGTTSDRQNIEDGFISGGNLPLNGSGVTVAAWFRYSTHEPYSRFYQVGGDMSTPGANDAWELIFQDETSYPRVVTNNGGDVEFTNLTLSTDTWYFVVTVLDGDNGTLYIYDQNGQQISGSPASASLPRNTGGDYPLVLMSADDAETTGRMEEVFAFSTALSASEVGTLYTNSF
jgi:hypothetical protein